MTEYNMIFDKDDDGRRSIIDITVHDVAKIRRVLGAALQSGYLSEMDENFVRHLTSELFELSKE